MSTDIENCLNCKYARWEDEAHGKIGTCQWVTKHFKKKPRTLMKWENLGIMYSQDTNVVSMFSGGNLTSIDSCDTFEPQED